MFKILSFCRVAFLLGLLGASQGLWAAGFARQAGIVAPDGSAGDEFGHSVSVSGNTLVVGSRKAEINGVRDQGAAYIFVRGSDNAWSQQQKLTASDGTIDDLFGYTPVLDGDTLVVGVDDADVNGNAGQGKVYVFVRSGTSWREQAVLTASDGATNDLLGLPVDVDGDTLVAGAGRADISGKSDQGAAYIFVRSGTTWSQQTKLTASDGAARDLFGQGVALSGNTVVISASEADVGGAADQGAIYIFTRSGTTWTERAKLTASDGATGDLLGPRVALSGATLVAGARKADVAGRADQGAAYVFMGSGANWIEQAKLVASGGAAGDTFGDSVAIDTNHIVVLASKEGNSSEGSVFIFERTGASWSQTDSLTSLSGTAGASFGRNGVTISGDTVGVGAWYADINGQTDQGGAYVYVPPAVTVSPVSVEVTEGGTTRTYTLVLKAQPSDNVTVSVAGDSQAAVSPSTLTFTGSNWNTAQTVSVTAVDDSKKEGGHSATVTHSLTSSDSKYSGLAVSSVVVNIVDNDTAGAALSAKNISVKEGGATGSYTLVLTTQPNHTVVITAKIGGDPHVSLSTERLIFTPSNWNVPQSITILTATDDTDVEEGDHSATVTHAAASVDSDYNRISIPSLTVYLSDNVTIVNSGGTSGGGGSTEDGDSTGDDEAGVTISEEDISVNEGGGTANYTLVLNTQPTDEVAITASVSGDSHVSVAPENATFTPSDWTSKKTVTIVTTEDDAEVEEGDHQAVIAHTAVSNDANYHRLAIESIVVNISDNIVTSVDTEDPDGENSDSGTSGGGCSLVKKQ